MSSSSENIDPKFKAPVSRRKFLGYAFVASILLLIGAFAIIFIHATENRPELFDLGATTKFGESPTPRAITLRDGHEVRIFIVRTADQFLALDARTHIGLSDCWVQWQPSFGRFEDPCSGGKFTRAGEYIDTYSYLKGATVSNLDRYSVSVKADHVIVDMNQLNRGKNFVARVLTPECCFP